jgi:hypothetical protein
MQEAAVFLGIRATARMLYAEKARTINKNEKGKNSTLIRKLFESVDFMKQPFNNAIYHLVQQK